MSDRIQQILESTKTILRDCSLDNGGIVAANCTKRYFPATAKNYFYVWPRDAAFACMAADMLGMTDIQENFFSWCLDSAEGLKTDGMFYEKYHPNGLKALSRFQPDQTGAVLLAVWHHFKWHQSVQRASKYEALIINSADGICDVWDNDHFSIPTTDLWEERTCFPDLVENFSYSLAACIRGLQCAGELVPNDRWLRVAREMKSRLDEHYMDFFMRSYGDLPDQRIDASVIGLVYPYEIYDPDDDRIVASVRELEDKLAKDGGIHRYEHDEYDGWMFDGRHRKKGGGAWPLLNFWLSVYFQRAGDIGRAKEYYHWVIDRMGESNFIPEQIFENDIQVSVSPLLWSHAMFALASKELNYF